MSIIDRLLTELDTIREQVLVALAPLTDEALQLPGVISDWSVADLLVNCTAWESEMVTALMRLQQNKKPDRLLQALANSAAYDQERYAENQGRSLDRVFDDLMKVRLELEEWLEMFSDRQLNDKKRYKWLNGRSLADLVAQTTFDHERRYLPAIQTFAREWEAGQTADLIPLTAVEKEDDNSNK